MYMATLILPCYIVSVYSDVVERSTQIKRSKVRALVRLDLSELTMRFIITDYYCQGGTTTPNYTLCTAYYYCVARSNAPTPCPAGSFSSNTGNIYPTNCDLYSWVLLFKLWQTHRTLFCLILLYCGSKLLVSSLLFLSWRYWNTITVSSWGLSRQHSTNRLLGLSCWKVRRIWSNSSLLDRLSLNLSHIQ